MRVFSRWLLGLAMLVCIAMPAYAVLPDEVLDDPVLEERARELSKELRCVVCQSENIDASDASVARDLRIVLREQLVEGKTDEEVLEFMRTRYGDYILMRPRFNGSGIALWLTGPLLFLLGIFFAIMFIRRSGELKEVPDAEDEL